MNSVTVLAWHFGVRCCAGSGIWIFAASCNIFDVIAGSQFGLTREPPGVALQVSTLLAVARPGLEMLCPAPLRPGPKIWANALDAGRARTASASSAVMWVRLMFSASHNDRGWGANRHRGAYHSARGAAPVGRPESVPRSGASRVAGQRKAAVGSRELRRVTITREHATHRTGERDELRIPAKREGSTRLEAVEQRLLPRRHRNAAELRDGRDHLFRPHQ